MFWNKKINKEIKQLRINIKNIEGYIDYIGNIINENIDIDTNNRELIYARIKELEPKAKRKKK